MASKSSPSDADLLDALKHSQSEHPDAGAPGLQTSILTNNPTWTVSEKRVKKLLRVLRGEVQPEAVLPAPEAVRSPGKGTRRKSQSSKQSSEPSYPTSHLNDDLQVEDYTKKVQAKYLDDKRGKGLVAVDSIKEGEILWKEEPFVYSPSWEIQEAQRLSRRCSRCALPLPSPKSPPIYCSEECGTAWCNRLCATRDKPSHALLCQSQNPAAIPLLQFIQEERWIAVAAWARVVASLLGEWIYDPNVKPGEGPNWTAVRSLAALSLKERIKVMPNWQATLSANTALWKKTHKLYLEAFDTPSNPASAKKLAKLKKNKKLPPEIHKELFGYDGFLVGLGKMSLNIELHGGLYRLHSHLNHDCDPNISVRHFEGPAQPGKITVIAKRDIAPGEELLITYVNPANDVRQRRRELKEWGFGECQCSRCTEEATSLPSSEDSGDGAAPVDAGELENELRGFLGV